MATKIPRSAFAATHELPDWRIVLHAIEASFTAASFSDGAAFLAEVAQAADAVDHHPDLDLRYPGTGPRPAHQSRRRRPHRARRAARDDDLGAGGRARPDERAPNGSSASRWRSTRSTSPPCSRSGGRRSPTRTSRPRTRATPSTVSGIPSGIGPAFWFQQMDEPRPQRNRIHLDVVVPEDELPDRLGAALAAGGTAAHRSVRAGLLGARRCRGQRGVPLHVAGPRLTLRLRPPARPSCARAWCACRRGSSCRAPSPAGPSTPSAAGRP